MDSTGVQKSDRLSRTETVSAGGSKTTQHVSSYSYDAIYQLTQVVLDGNVSESYAYDAVGNRLSALGSSPWNYSDSNELLSTPNASFVYDLE
jgi:YD repeat-containing protein